MPEEFPALRAEHYRAYDLDAVAVEYDVGLRGQFDDGFRKHRLTSLEHFANPVDKNGEGIREPRAHQTWYRLAPSREPRRRVVTENQFGRFELLIEHPEMLLVPAEKIEKGSALLEKLDHYKCYRVVEGEPAERAVSLHDQFLRSDRVRVREPLFFCVPVAKRYKRREEKIYDEKSHLVIYRTSPHDHGTRREVRDQFDRYELTIRETALLAVPSRKLKWGLD